MKIHEYQGKELFRKYGVPVPRGILATTPAEAEQAARQLDTQVVVVKAQIHAGGRGKGGGVKLARSPAEARKLASEILGMQLRTHQTGPAGQKVRKVYIEEGLDIARELYLGMTLDRALSPGQPHGLERGRGGDRGGGRQASGEASHVESVDPGVGLPRLPRPEAGLRARPAPAPPSGASSPSAAHWSAVTWRPTLSLAEVNPLVVLKDGGVVALDAKMNFDDNALYRHPDVAALPRRGRGGPARGQGQGVRPGVHRARREHRLHGERRRPGDGHHGHHQAGGRGAGELPRRRRRGHPGEGDGGLQADSRRPEGEGRAGQHLRRHHEVRRDRRRSGGGGHARSSCACRWWCGSKAPTWRRARRFCATSGLAITPADNLRQAAEKAVAAVRGGEVMSILVDDEHTRPRARASPAPPAPSTAGRCWSTGRNWWPA